MSSNSFFSVSEYTTFLSLPVNATQVHIVNRAPLFTHMGERHHFYFIVSTTGLKLEVVFGISSHSCKSGGSIHCLRDGQHGAECDPPIPTGWWPPRVPSSPDPWPFARDGGAAASRTTATGYKHTGPIWKKLTVDSCFNSWSGKKWNQYKNV